MIQIFLVLGLALMLYNLFYSLQLRGVAPGGIIGNRLTQLIFFIGLFTAGYLAVGLLTFGRPADTLLLILSLILAFGAMFVFLVLRLVQAILQALES